MLRDSTGQHASLNIDQVLSTTQVMEDYSCQRIWGIGCAHVPRKFGATSNWERDCRKVALVMHSFNLTSGDTQAAIIADLEMMRRVAFRWHIFPQSPPAASLVLSRKSFLFLQPRLVLSLSNHVYSSWLQRMAIPMALMERTRIRHHPSAPSKSSPRPNSTT